MARKGEVEGLDSSGNSWYDQHQQDAHYERVLQQVRIATTPRRQGHAARHGAGIFARSGTARGGRPWLEIRFTPEGAGAATSVEVKEVEEERTVARSPG